MLGVPVKRRSTRRTDFGARLPNGGEATGFTWPSGFWVVYDEVAKFTKADWETVDRLIRSDPYLMGFAHARWGQ
jgi:hypothetical protein